LSGVSRTIRIRRRRSFSVTSAARVSRLSPRPCAIAASDFIEQGATTMAAVAKLPLAMQAPMSPGA
jgi:head-tail adaptor